MALPKRDRHFTSEQKVEIVKNYLYQKFKEAQKVNIQYQYGTHWVHFPCQAYENALPELTRESIQIALENLVNNNIIKRVKREKSTKVTWYSFCSNEI